MQPLFASFFTFIVLLFISTKTPVLPPTYTGFIHRLTHITVLNSLLTIGNEQNINTKKRRYASHNGVFIY